MDGSFEKVVSNIVRLVALYIFTVNSYPALPTETTRLVLLLLTTAYTMYFGYRFHKSNRYFPTMFTWSLSMMPWAFYLEMRLLYGSFEIDMVKYVDKYSHSIVVYNGFRYVLLLFVSYVVLKDLYKSFKNL